MFSLHAALFGRRGWRGFRLRSAWGPTLRPNDNRVAPYRVTAALPVVAGLLAVGNDIGYMRYRQRALFPKKYMKGNFPE